MPEDTLRQLSTLPLPDLFQLIQIGIGMLQVGISGLGLSAIFWGLIQMQKAGRRRDREIDVLAETMRESTRVLGESLERQGQTLGQTLGQVGQALERSGSRTTRPSPRPPGAGPGTAKPGVGRAVTPQHLAK